MQITLERGLMGLQHFPESAHSSIFGIGFSKVCLTDNQWTEMLFTSGVQRSNKVGNIASDSTFLKVIILTSVLKLLTSPAGKKSN